MQNSKFSSSVRDALSLLQIANWEVFHFESVNSTNTKAKKLLEVYPNTAILADEQDSGRGTKGRNWHSPVGGVWLSIGASGKFPVVPYSQIVAKRLAGMLSDLLDYDCDYKVENDIFLAGRKLAGVLVETKISGDFIEQIIIGVGINNQNKIPEHLSDIAISLRELTVIIQNSSIALEVALEVIFVLREAQRGLLEDLVF